MNKIDYAKISSDNIRYLLIKNNMSIRQLADKIGVYGHKVSSPHLYIYLLIYI